MPSTRTNTTHITNVTNATNATNATNTTNTTNAITCHKRHKQHKIPTHAPNATNEMAQHLQHHCDNGFNCGGLAEHFRNIIRSEWLFSLPVRPNPFPKMKHILSEHVSFTEKKLWHPLGMKTTTVYDVKLRKSRA
jgi:hypothetical protein